MLKYTRNGNENVEWYVSSPARLAELYKNNKDKLHEVFDGKTLAWITDTIKNGKNSVGYILYIFHESSVSSENQRQTITDKKSAIKFFNQRVFDKFNEMYGFNDKLTEDNLVTIVNAQNFPAQANKIKSWYGCNLENFELYKKSLTYAVDNNLNPDGNRENKQNKNVIKNEIESFIKNQETKTREPAAKKKPSKSSTAKPKSTGTGWGRTLDKFRGGVTTEAAKPEVKDFKKDIAANTFASIQDIKGIPNFKVLVGNDIDVPQANHYDVICMTQKFVGATGGNVRDAMFKTCCEMADYQE